MKPTAIAVHFNSIRNVHVTYIDIPFNGFWSDKLEISCSNCFRNESIKTTQYNVKCNMYQNIISSKFTDDCLQCHSVVRNHVNTCIT